MKNADLRKIVRKLGTTEVARAAGLKVQTVDSWMHNPTANMRQDNHAKLLSAVEQMMRDASPDPVQEEYLDVPVYDIRAAAGAGAFADDSVPVTHEKFRLNFLSRLTRAPVSMLSVIEVTGDSMEPTIYGGDHVLVDHSVRGIDHGGIYILRMDETNIVKRCHRSTSDKSIHVISDNQKYPVDVVKSADRLDVIGRVIWIGRALR